MRNRTALFLLATSFLFSVVALGASLGGVFYPPPYQITTQRPTCDLSTGWGSFWVGRYYTGGSAIDRLELCSVASPTGTPTWHYVTVGTAAAAN